MDFRNDVSSLSILSRRVEIQVRPSVGDFLDVVFVRKHGMIFGYMRYLKDGWFGK
jgi:hypothetical protein